MRRLYFTIMAFSLTVYLLALIICVLMAGMLSSFPNSHSKKKNKG